MSWVFGWWKVAVAMLVLVSGAILIAPRPFIYAYEDARFALDPSPSRAFEYGEKYFNAIDPKHYDVVRAEYFFEKAARDQSLPYVNHELARISFLKGDFDLALSRINLQISLQGTSTPNSYYIRGLIEGFRGDYASAARDYETYLHTDSRNWAAINDYAWVLLKANRPKDALVAVDWGLIYWPQNPWLLNSRATALFEMGRWGDAHEAVVAAEAAVASVDEKAWLHAYPGNDPLIAAQGVTAFKKAVDDNMHTIEAKIEVGKKTVQ